MAQWRKVVVSGSSAELNGLTLSGDLTVEGGDITLGSTSIFSGGNTTSLNNIDAIDATTESTIEGALDTLSNLTTTGTLNSGAISSGFGNIDIGTSTINAGNTTLDILINASSVAASHITGSMTGSFIGDGSGLTGISAGGIDHDSLSGFVANEHIDHSGVTITAGAGMTGGGTIAATRTLDVVGGTGITANADNITTNDSEIVHDNLSGFVANEHIDHSSVSITTGTGLSGGGDITSTRTLTTDDSAIVHDNLSGFVANEHIDHSGVTITAGTGMTGGGTIAATRTLNVIGGDGITANAGDVAVTAANTNLTSILNGSLTKIGTGASQEYITFGTTDEVNTFVNNTERLSVTATGVDVTGALTVSTNATIEGNLDVNGTLTTIDSTNLKIADQFIMAASGSDTADGGLIVETNGAGSGTAFAWDHSSLRWGFTRADDTAHDATSVTPRQYVVSVSGSGVSPSGNPSDFGASDATRAGMMHVNTSNGEIWIYS
jgi:hypothetical protein